jgi:SAM-dependent methyltransferase
MTLDRGDVRYHPALKDDTIRNTLLKIPHRERKTVADLGCGPGALLPFLSDHFAEVVAIDYAPASLAAARERIDSGNVRFRRRDLRDLTPFRNSFHLAVAIDSILGPRLEDVDRILSQVHGSLQEGGILLATFPAAPRCGKPVEMSLAGDGSACVPVRLQEMELQYRLRKAGFRGIRIRRVDGGEGDPPRLLGLAVRRANN